jgi:signal transduction histidine kinase
MVPRSVADLGDAASYAVKDRLQLPSRLDLTDERKVRRWASHSMRLFWSLAIGIIAALLPLSIASVLLSPAYVPVFAVMALLVVGLVTYAGDWRSGLAAIAASFLLLAWWATADLPNRLIPPGASEQAMLASVIAGGLVIALTIERLKLEGSIDRQEALAARSAATALSAVETVAATQQHLSPQAQRQLHEAIVRAVVGVNRAHAGALLLVNADGSDLRPVALYGFGDAGETALIADARRNGFVSRIQQERRTLQVSGLRRSAESRYPQFRQIRIRSMLGTPIIGHDDHILGVLLVGLLVDHQFPPQEIRKLEALASQVSSILETMALMGKRESQLRQAQDEQRRLERLIAAVPEALIVTVPPKGQIIAMNTAAQVLFGEIETDELIQRVHRAENEDGQALIPTEAALTFGDTMTDVECIVTTADRRRVPVLASAAPILNDDGSTWAVVTAFRDISALKEASRLKDEFVSVVSHELRSPLTPIRGFVQLVARELSREGGHDREVRQLESVSGHVDRLTRLVDDLLDVSRLRSGSLEIREASIDLVALCRQVIDAHTTHDGHHRLSFESTMESLIGFWDPDRIHQVLDNLIMNAIKYGGERPTVSLHLFVNRDDAVIEVLDSGPGIDEHQRAAIFGAFYRSPEVLAGQVQGLGLGLYICRELVEAHGGTIDVRSGEEGGAVFVVRLPLRAEARQPLPDGTAVDPGGNATMPSPLEMIEQAEMSQSRDVESEPTEADVTAADPTGIAHDEAQAAAPG